MTEIKPALLWCYERNSVLPSSDIQLGTFVVSCGCLDIMHLISACPSGLTPTCKWHVALSCILLANSWSRLKNLLELERFESLCKCKTEPVLFRHRENKCRSKTHFRTKLVTQFPSDVVCHDKFGRKKELFWTIGSFVVYLIQHFKAAVCVWATALWNMHRILQKARLQLSKKRKLVSIVALSEEWMSIPWIWFWTISSVRHVSILVALTDRQSSFPCLGIIISPIIGLTMNWKR